MEGAMAHNTGMNDMPHALPAIPDLRHLAWRALCEPDPTRKAALALVIDSGDEDVFAAQTSLEDSSHALPGRPEKPALTHPAKVPRRSPVTLEGRAAMIHAITHIEFNAINLALDALWRFDGMPHAYYRDWATVAREEAYHFSLLREHLRGMDVTAEGAPRWDYGDFIAHDGLWEMCEKTSHDVIARMALVPRTLEARGLDATPQIQAKLRQVRTADAMRAVEILDLILRDEIGHVAIGNRWYRWLCDRQRLNPVDTYAELTERYKAPKLRPPFNHDARRKAGFTSDEIALLGG